jgi:hypothetical protein
LYQGILFYIRTFLLNEGISADGLYRQVAAWFKDMFCNFHLVKNHKIAKNSTTTKAREKNKHRFRIPRIFKRMFDEIEKQSSFA